MAVDEVNKPDSQREYDDAYAAAGNRQRRIVQIAVASAVSLFDSTRIYALCNDASVWLHTGGDEWRRLPDIPQK